MIKLYDLLLDWDIRVPCDICKFDLSEELIDESDHENAHKRWSNMLDVHCAKCGAINIFYVQWTVHTVTLHDVEMPVKDDPRGEALTAAERNKSLCK